MYYWENENCIKPPLIVIAGPTGVGKTAASVRLASEIGGEIVSADSMQVYKHMDIGTAKVTKAEMQGVPHHLIDILEPYEDYDVTRFKEMAKAAVSDITARGRIPILCGGTGFYIQALLYDIDFTDEDEEAREASEAIRTRYYKEAEERGRAFVHERLKAIDPLSYERIPANNLKRVVRALEFYELHGEPISAHNDREAEKTKKSPYDYRFFALTDDRARLYGRIDKRVDRMMEAGLLSEVERLRAMGIPADATSMQAIGYRELMHFLDKIEKPEASFGLDQEAEGSGDLESSRSELLSLAVDEIKKNSRHYAKRQLTWLRRDKNVIMINISETGDVVDELKKHLHGNGNMP